GVGGGVGVGGIGRDPEAFPFERSGVSYRGSVEFGWSSAAPGGEPTDGRRQRRIAERSRRNSDAAPVPGAASSFIGGCGARRRSGLSLEGARRICGGGRGIRG